MPKLKFLSIKLKSADYIIIAIFLAVAGFFIISWTTGMTGSERILLVASPQGNYEYSLYQDKILHIQGVSHKSVIHIKNGKAGFIESHCPKNICLQFGFISSPGTSAICVPNRVSITIISTKKKNSADTICR